MGVRTVAKTAGCGGAGSAVAPAIKVRGSGISLLLPTWGQSPGTVSRCPAIVMTGSAAFPVVQQGGGAALFKAEYSQLVLHNCASALAKPVLAIIRARNMTRNVLQFFFMIIILNFEKIYYSV